MGRTGVTGIAGFPQSSGGLSVGIHTVLHYAPAALGISLPIGFLLLNSVLPVIKVLLIAATGLVFALPRVGVLHAAARHSLSKLVFTIFLPAIIFVNLGEAITLENLLHWWFIPANVIIASVIGCLIGMACAKATNAPPEFFRIVYVLTGIGNMGNLPLVLLSAVCSDSRNPFGDSATCNRTGTAYISLGMWMAAIIMWAFVYNIVAPPEEWLEGYVKPQPLNENNSNRQPPEAYTVATYGMSGKNLNQPPTESEEAAAENGEQTSIGHPLLRQASVQLLRTSSAIVSSVKESAFHRWMTFLHVYDILRPPVLAAFLAMFVGTIPPLTWLIFDQAGPLRFLADSISILGQAMIPCILLTLGGNLVGGPGSSAIPRSTTWVIVFTRLLVVPAIGICVVLTADHLGFLPPDDPMFRFILFLQHAMPSSIQIGTACTLRGFGEKEVSAVLFYQHLVAIVTMTVYLFIFFFLLFGRS